MNIWMIVLFLVLGFILGYYKPFSAKIYSWADTITRIGLAILLASMGAKIGVDERVLSQLDTLGLQAFLLALASIMGSIIVIKLFSLQINFEINDQDYEEDKLAGGGQNGFMTYLIICSVIGGILSGLYLIPSSFFSGLDIITSYALAILLFGVGIDIGQNRDIFFQLKEFGLQVIVIPLLVIVGSIIGAVVLGYFLGIAFNEAAAVAAGFGWYSLSGVLISKIHSVELGSLAFLSNVFRELITVLTLPFIVKHFGKLTSIAPGGATTMDVSLPLIKETAGEQMVIPAFINGVILSSLVPILVPLLLNL